MFWDCSEAAVWFGYGFVLASETLFLGVTQDTTGMIVASVGVVAYSALAAIVLKASRPHRRRQADGDTGVCPPLLARRKTVERITHPARRLARALPDTLFVPATRE